MYSSWVSSVIRDLVPGYICSFSRKKQYAQSRLHVEPVGLASRWNDGGRPFGSVMLSGISLPVPAGAGAQRVKCN